jgi:hypothetical protein
MAKVNAVQSGLARQEAARADNIQSLCRLRREARDEISRLIQFLDDSDEYVMTEFEEDGELEDVGDSEPSLGSFDRMVNQEKSYRQVLAENIPGIDAELDEADSEPSLGACESHPSAPPVVIGRFGPVCVGTPERRYSTQGDQTCWGRKGGRDDREDDAGDNPERDEAESGTADEDGQPEQVGYQVFKGTSARGQSNGDRDLRQRRR